MNKYFFRAGDKVFTLDLGDGSDYLAITTVERERIALTGEYEV